MYSQKEIDEIIKDTKTDWDLYYSKDGRNCYEGSIFKMKNTDILRIILPLQNHEHLVYPTSSDEIEDYPDVSGEIEILNASGLFDKNANIKTEYYVLKRTINFVPDKEGFIKVYKPMPFSGIGISIENDKKIYFLIDGKSYFAIEGNSSVDQS